MKNDKFALNTVKENNDSKTRTSAGCNRLATRFSRWRAQWMVMIWGAMTFSREVLSDHRSGTISHAFNYVGKRDIIRDKICRQWIEICHLCCINAQKSEKKKFVAQRINYGANKPHKRHKQGFFPMSQCFIELEGEVGLLFGRSEYFDNQHRQP